MITAGEPQEFVPLGRHHLGVHPGDVYLPTERIPAANDCSTTGALLLALRGVSIKDEKNWVLTLKEQWFLKENPEDDSEEEFYWNGKTVIWSRSSGHGVNRVLKSFTMENPVLQVLWSEFRIRSCKPRILDAEIEMENKKDIVSGICIVEKSSVSVFAKTGEDFIVATPFQVLRAWTSKYGVLFERNVALDEKQDNCNSKFQTDNLPVIFSMMHPLDDIAPVISKRVSSSNININYFCDSSEEIVFCSSNPSLVLTYNKKGYHSVWKLRTTTFQEAEYACSKIRMDTSSKTNHTPLLKTSITKVSHTKLSLSSRTTPSTNVSSPFQSFPSTRVNSPSVLGHSSSPSFSSLTHMATLSRSQPPSMNSNLSQPQNYTPLSTLSHRTTGSPMHTSDSCTFMEPLAPDICFEFEWSNEGACRNEPEKASKVFLSKDITGHNFLCYLLKERKCLRLVKFEDLSNNQQWIFGSTGSIPACDAEPLSDLNLIIVVDTNLTLTLYTGLLKVCKVHVADVLGPTTEVACHVPKEMDYATPKRKSLVSSTRPPSATITKFGDESQVMSPVPMCVDDDGLGDAKPIMSDEIMFVSIGPVKSVRDSVKNRVTVDASTGYYRLHIPEVTVSITVSKCLQALKYILPRDIYTQVFIKWYCTRNAPGPTDMDTKAELNLFLTCLLNLIGFDGDKVTIGDCLRNSSSCSIQVKKQKTHEKGCDEDWYELIATNPNKSSIEYKFFNQSVPLAPSEDSGLFNTSAVLFPYIGHILFSIHLVYEDCKLDVALWNDLSLMCSFLTEIARELRQFNFLDHYWKDFPEQFNSVRKIFILNESDVKKMHIPTYFSSAPSIYHCIKRCLTGGIIESFPYIPTVTKMLQQIILVYAVLTSVEKPVLRIKEYLSPVTASGVRVKDEVNDSLLSSCYKISHNPKKAAVFLISKLGLNIEDINSLPIGLALPIKDALLNCRHEPSGLWTKDIFDLIGRRDLSSLQSTEKKCYVPQATKTKQECGKSSSKDSDDGLNHLDMEVLRLRFGQDHRVHDVFHMLQSSKPVRIALQQRPEVSDHEFIEEQERHLYNLCIRTMAATVGRGMFTLRAYNPVVTEALPIPKLCLTGRAPPRNTTVDLAHIDVPPNMNMWPLFHNGVAAGLSISLTASKIDSTWMVYNKPRSSGNDTPTEHAGFLMALGLNGHLSRLTTLSIHDYLCRGHELTSVGLLLGVSAAKRGTMDLGVTKLLSIHMEALLPPTSTELDVAPAVQVAAVMGLGLLYQGSGHHHMAEVLLGEIGRPPGPEMEHSIDRESYSLAAGLALGLITLGKGKEMSGVADFPMADQLYHYMVGGHKRPLTGIHKEKHKSPSYQIREGDNVNVDVTSPGATLALGMMFFDTDNKAIADWMTAPDTQFLLDMVRPDFLLLRTISKGLILWSSIHPSVKWVESHLPEIVAKHAFQRGVTHADVDYETMSQAYCNIIAGGCFCLGLKFAGSANAEAFETLMQYAKHFLSLSRKHVGEQAGRSTIETCLNVVVLSLAMVMAGTGDLDVIRICRHLRSRISQAASYVLYGSHMVTHMALGLLFLGGGRFTLSTSPLSVGAMVCAFFPKFPQHSNDNRYHLQAFYHLYVLAVEPRLIVPRLIDSNKPVYINIKVKFKDTLYYKGAEFSVKAPCILPELKFLKQVIIEDSRYWPIVFDCDENWDVLKNLLERGGTLNVMQNAGCLPYNEDPQGFRSSLAQSYIWNNVHAWNIKNVQISSFSSDPVALNFASCFLTPAAASIQEKEWQQKICGFLFECASLEKMEALPICIAMIQMSRQTSFKYHTFEMWQVKLLSAYEKWIKTYSSHYNDSLTLLRPDFSLAITSETEKAAKKAVEGLQTHLLQYVSQNWTSTNNVLRHYPSELVGFLSLHDVQITKPLNLQSEGEIILPVLYRHLHDLNLSVSSMMSILSVLAT